MPRPRRYRLPDPVRAALETVFGEPVDGVTVVEHSRLARLHLGMRATTRPERILLARGGDEFAADPALVLHEYFHVLRQWRPGRLTRTVYLVESIRRGYAANRYEREANVFVNAHLARFEQLLAQAREPGGLKIPSR
jgi:hypothetical protein